MNISSLSREEKEALYYTKQVELQKSWGNPINFTLDEVKGHTDAELNESLMNTLDQLSFEKKLRAFKIVAGVAMAAIIGWLFIR